MCLRDYFRNQKKYNDYKQVKAKYISLNSNKQEGLTTTAEYRKQK